MQTCVVSRGSAASGGVSRRLTLCAGRLVAQSGAFRGPSSRLKLVGGKRRALGLPARQSGNGALVGLVARARVAMCWRRVAAAPAPCVVPAAAPQAAHAELIAIRLSAPENRQSQGHWGRGAGRRGAAGLKLLPMHRKAQHPPTPTPARQRQQAELWLLRQHNGTWVRINGGPSCG
jgi:hypothetical protein